MQTLVFVLTSALTIGKVVGFLIPTKLFPSNDVWHKDKLEIFTGLRVFTRISKIVTTRIVISEKSGEKNGI